MKDQLLYLHSVGIAAPGLPDWPTACEVLRGAQALQAADLPPYLPKLLPPNERRRASRAVIAAFRVAEEAVQGCDPAQLATVFSCADGDQYITERICQALAGAERMVSPTDFHHSVHNAPVGNWSIAARAEGPSTALAAWSDSFACALIESSALALAENRPVLLVCFDIAPPALLSAQSLARSPFAVALRCTPSAGPGALATLSLRMAPGAESRCAQAATEKMRNDNPAGRCLPLLEALARRASARVQLALGANEHVPGLQVDVRPL